jgi:hypothetical protein
LNARRQLGIVLRHHSDENMSTAGGDHPFDTMDEFRHEGWVFLCSAEQLPDGSFHASVR